MTPINYKNIKTDVIYCYYQRRGGEPRDQFIAFVKPIRQCGMLYVFKDVAPVYALDQLRLKVSIFNSIEEFEVQYPLGNNNCIELFEMDNEEFVSHVIMENI